MLVNRISVLQKELKEIYMTNINIKGEEHRRAVYFIHKDNVSNRRGNVILEVWETKEDGVFDLYFKREFLNEKEYEEAKKHYRTTSGRGVIKRNFTDMELVRYIKEKLSRV